MMYMRSSSSHHNHTVLPACMCLCAIAVLLLCSFAPLLSTHALINKLTITKDSRVGFNLQTFGFDEGGRFLLYIRDFKATPPPKALASKDSDIVFILRKSNVVVPLQIELVNCLQRIPGLGNDTIIRLFNNKPTFNFQENITVPGFYHLYFSNCLEKTTVSFKATIIEYNVGANGKKNYLSAGISSLPTVYLVLTLFFVLEIAAWSVNLRMNKENIRKIHYFMLGVVFLQMFTVLFEARKYAALREYGVAPGWKIPYYICYFLKSVSLFAVIVLIGTGWSYMKPVLSQRDKRFVTGVLMIQVLLNLVLVVWEEMTPGALGWWSYKNLFALLDIICCIAVLLPIVSSIRTMRAEQANDDAQSIKVAQFRQRLKKFQQFYLLIIAYIYLTRVIKFLFEASLPLHAVWVGEAFPHAVSLWFYAVTGYLFRPMHRNPYLPLEQMELDDVMESVPSAEEMLEDDLSFNAKAEPVTAESVSEAFVLAIAESESVTIEPVIV